MWRCVRRRLLTEFLQSLLANGQQIGVLLLDLLLSRADRVLIETFLFVDRDRFLLDLLQVRGGHEALSIVDLDFPPVLVRGVEQNEGVALLHGDFARRLLDVVVQAEHFLSLPGEIIGDEGLLRLVALLSLLTEILQFGLLERFDVVEELLVLLVQRIARVFIATVISGLSDGFLLPRRRGRAMVEEKSQAFETSSLLNPRFNFFGIAEVLLSLKGVFEIVLALHGHFLQVLPFGLQVDNVLLDLRGSEVT